MKKLNLRGKLFSRFLFSYLLMVLVPLGIIGSFYVAHFYQAFQREVLSNVNKDLVNLSTRIDTELSIMQNTVRQIEISSQLNNFTSEFHSEKINNAKTMLANFSATNSFVSDIFLVLPDMEYVINSSTSNRLSYFAERFYQIDNLSPQDLLQFLVAPHRDVLPLHTLRQFMYQPEDILLFNYPVYTDYLKQMGNVVFQIPFKSVEKLFSDKLSGYSATSFLLNEHHKVVAAVNSTPELSLWADNLSQNSDAMAGSLKALQSEFFVCSFSSPESKFTSISLIPRDQHTFAQITQLNLLFIFSLLVAATVSLVAVFYAMRFNYAPLRKLQDKAGQLIKRQRSKDEILDIENALDLLSGRTSYLEGKLETTAISVKSARLQRLLADCYSSVQDFNLDCQELDMQFTFEHLLVTTSYVHHKQQDLELLAQQIKEVLGKSVDTYYLKAIDNHKLIILHSVPPESSFDDFILLYTKLHRQFFDEQGLTITTGIGTIITDAREASQSYLNSSLALDYRFVKGNGEIICFSEIDSKATGTYPHHLFDKLKNALQTNNSARIDSCIADIIEGVKSSNYPLTLARSMCFDLVNTVTNRGPDGKGNQPFIPLNLFALAEIETIHDIITFLTKWQQEVLSRNTIVSIAKPQAVVIKDILVYMQKNATSCDFSLSETAEYFGMTLPKFSQFFKDEMNKDALSYLIQLRMQKAASLLAETNSSVDSIAQQTGYYNTSSFIRRFKQIHGITPIEYRKISVKK